MVGEGGANLKDVQRVLKDAQISALSMVGAVGASSKDVVQAQNGERISALSTGRVCWVVTMLSLKLCLPLQKNDAGPRSPKRQQSRLRPPKRMSQQQLLLVTARNTWAFFS